MNKRTAIKHIATFAVLTGTIALFSACNPQQASFSSIDVTGAEYAKDFELTDHNGQVRHLRDFAGKVVVMFFGYTQCPDVCPTSMSELAEVKRALGSDGERLQGLFVSVDPQRDTPELLKAYMENFDPTFLALHVPPDKLAALAKEFRVYYKRVEGQTPTSYTMDHSAGSYVYDTKGQLRLFTRYGSGPKGLTQDIRLLLKQAQ
ncbi:MAG: SCO family protein [Rhodoferax sp.]|nr:SCO family protein [Rhodoferax sp.]